MQNTGSEKKHETGDQPQRKSPYTAKMIARYFLDRENLAGRAINSTRMMMMVYAAHGLSLAENNRPLFDEPVEAWRYRPVIPSLHEELMKSPDANIKNINAEPANPQDPETRELLEKVTEVYGPMDKMELMRIAHGKGSPWDEIEKDQGDRDWFGEKISNESIKRHFVQIGNEAKKNAMTRNARETHEKTPAR